MKRQTLLTIACCLVVTLGLYEPVTASLINMDIGGNRVVYDNFNDLYWYPILTDFTGMTLNEQLTAIDALEYGGMTNWKMASWSQTSLLKLSLATMVTEEVMPTAFGPEFGTPVYENITIASPFLAWNVDSSEFFTPTDNFDFPMIGATGMDVFNGRTSGWGMTNTGDGGFWGDIVWSNLPADDHWVSVNLMNAGDDNLTMIFNFDQHRRNGDDLENPVMGAVGAWVVAKPVPEPSSMLLFGTAIASLVGRRNRRRK